MIFSRRKKSGFHQIDAFIRYDVLTDDEDKFKYFISGIVYDFGSGLLVSPNISSTRIIPEYYVYKLNDKINLIYLY